MGASVHANAAAQAIYAAVTSGVPSCVSVVRVSVCVSSVAVSSAAEVFAAADV